MSFEGAVWFFIFGLCVPVAMTVVAVSGAGWVGLLCLLLIPALWVFAMKAFGIWQ